MNAHQRRVYRRLYERAFGNHVDYYVEIRIGDETMGESKQSYSAQAIQDIIDGKENPFHTIEALGEHVQQLWMIMGNYGAEVWEKDKNGALHRPKGEPGTMVYHLRAVDNYQNKVFQVMAALLPDLYAASEGDPEALIRIKWWLEEMRDFQQRRWSAYS